MKHELFSFFIFSCAAISTAVAIDTPQPKPGWWEMRSTADGKTGAARMCTTASEAAQSKQVNDDFNKKNCSKNETRQEGDKWITDMVCKMGDSTMSDHSVIVFDGDNAYHTESTATYNPPFNGRSSKNVTLDAKWLGACKPGRMPEVVK